MLALKPHSQQNAPVLWGCQLTQVVLYNGHKIVVVTMLCYQVIKCINIHNPVCCTYGFKIKNGHASLMLAAV